MSDFPTKQNPQPCKNGCGTRIYLSNKNGRKRWLPYELDDTVHECPNKPNPGLDKFTNNTPTRTTTETITDITGQPGHKEPTIQQLKIWIAKLEKNGIHIDINEILNPKNDEKEEQND